MTNKKTDETENTVDPIATNDDTEAKARSRIENGRLIIQSPLADMPGTIEVDVYLDPAAVMEYFKRHDNLPPIYQEEGALWVYTEFYSRFKMFDFKIPGLNSKTWDLENGKGFPSILAIVCVNETAGLIDGALNLKNLPGASKKP